MGRPKQRMFSAPDLLPHGLRLCFLIVDLGFIAYWATTMLHLIPAHWAFKDHGNPVLLDWNWSFFPLDLLISLSGLGSLILASQRLRQAVPLALVSLALTLCAGLQACAFWGLRGDFSWIWWLPNLFLLTYPLPFLGLLIRRSGR